MNGYIRVLKTESKEKDLEFLNRSKLIGDSVNCDNYSLPFFDDINELYCWLIVEESLTTLSFSEYEKQQIRTFENAIEEGLIVNNNTY